MKVLWVVLFFITTVFANVTVQNQFTNKELNYIKNNPIITIGMMSDFKPFSFDQNHIHQGMSVDILNKISDISGLSFSIKTSSWLDALNNFKAKKTNMISSISHTTQREKFTLFSSPYYEIPTYIFGLKSDKPYKGIDDLKGKNIGISRGIFYKKDLEKLGIKTIEFSGSKEKAKALALGNIDYFLAAFASGKKAIVEQGFINIKPLDEFRSIKKEDLRFGINKDNFILHSIIEKSLNKISSKEFVKLKEKWIFDLDELNTNSLKLSQDEFDYLKKKKTIKVCTPIDNYPFTMLDGDKIVGISIDMLQLISKKSNINFEMVKMDSLKEQFDMLRNHQCDMVPVVATQPNSFSFLTPTLAFGSSNVVIVTKIKEPYIADLSDLKSEKIGIFGENMIKYVKTLYPNINLVKLEDINIGKVADGSLYGFIATSLQVSYQIATLYSNELKIMSKIGDSRISGGFGVSNSEPMLLNILNKLLVAIPKTQKKMVFKGWYEAKVDDQINTELIEEIVTGFLFILLISIVALIVSRKHNKKLHRLIDSSIDGVVVSKNGICIDVNEEAVKFLGYENTKEMINKNIFDFVAPDFKIFVQKAIQENQNTYKCGLLKKDGSTISVLIKGSFLYNDKSTRISSFIDLTELEATQNELEILNKSLEKKVAIEVKKNEQQQLMMLQQSRLAQMGEIISMIAHQWRQPLNILSMTIQGVVFKNKRGLLDDKLIQQLDKNSKIQISQMSNTIDDFKNFFKPDKKREKFYILDAINKSISLIAPAFIDENIKFEFNIKEEITFLGYPNEFGQSLINILNNAKDALVQNNENKEKIIKIYLKDYSDRIVLHIQDNAGGIPTDIIGDIFNPYFSTKSNKNGTGLGLYMTKIIIEEHMGGRLSVINTEEGACFRMIFMKRRLI